MVAIVSGNSLGLSLSSLANLGLRGAIGTASQGRSGEQSYVNIATGNLVLQDRDDALFSHGADLVALRTYNSQGLLTDDNGDNWSQGTYSQQLVLSGTVNTTGSTVTRTARDGARDVYTWDSTRSAYLSKSGAGAYDTITYDSGNSRYVWTDGDTGTMERYDATTGRLTTTVDLSGNTSSFTYNANGTLASIADSSGETMWFDYTGTNLTQVRSGTSGSYLTRTRYTYDGSNRLVTVTTDLSPSDNSVTDSQTYVTTYTYDGTSKRIASVTQSDGTSLTFTYVQVGADYRVATVTDAASRVISYSYNTTTRQTTVTDPLGLATVYAYDTSGQLLSVTAPPVGGVSQVNSFVYNANGDVTSVTDGEGRTVTMEYDANGNQTLQRDSAGNTVTRTFDSANRLITESTYLTPDPDGAGSGQPSNPLTTRYVYDSSTGYLRFVFSAEGRATEYRYNSYGERTSEIHYLGGSFDLSSYTTTTAPSLATATNWAGTQDMTQTRRIDTAYDARGQVQRVTSFATTLSSGAGVTDGSESSTQYVYSQAGELLQTISPTTGSTVYTYDGLGRVRSVQNALTQTTLTSYDDANRKTSVTLASGLIATSTWDNAGRLISVLQTNSAATNLGTTQYFYDADSRLRMTQDPTGVRAWMLYDDAGRKVADIDGNGTLVEYVYDKNNHVTETIAYATAVNVSTLVDVNGKPTNPTLASIRPTGTAQDVKAWNAYDSANRLVKSVDAAGAVTEWTYDGASRVVAITRYATAITTSSLGATPTPASIAPTTNAADRVTRNFYDNDGLLRGTLDAEGYLVEYRYDRSGLLSSTIAYATATNTSYRASGTLAQLIPTSATSDIATYTLRDGKGLVTGFVDGEGYFTEYVYDASGNQTQSIRYATKLTGTVISGIGATTTVASLRPTTNAEDRTVARTYDTLNRVTQETNAEGTVTQYTYDNVGELTATTQAVGTGETRTLSARYDLQGRLIGELSAEGAALLTGGQTQAQIDTIWSQYGLTHTYDAAGRRMSTTDQNGFKTMFFYDVDGHLTQTVNALGEVRENQYDTLGRLTATVAYGTRISLTGLTGSNAGGLVNSTLTAAINAVKSVTLDSKVAYTYNTTGTIATATDALGNATSYSYDVFREATASTQTIGTSRTLASTVSYDRRGLQTASASDTASVNATTATTYDAFGRVVSRTDANGAIRQQSYDRLGRVVSTTDPLTATTSATYDAFDRVLTQTDALGKTTSYSYSKSARSVTVTTPEGVSVSTVRTRLGQTLSVTDGRGNVTSYTYDKNGNRLTGTTAGTTTETDVYDRASRLTQTTDANGNVVALTYDAANRVLTRTVDPTGLAIVTTWQYDAKGQQIAVIDANSVTTQLVYDLKGQLLRQVVDPTGLNLITQYTYDGRGKTLTVTDPNGNVVQYTYDNLGRRTLTQVDPSGLNLQTSYAYDKVGHVTSTTDPSSAVTRFAYDADGQLIYTVDPLGRVTQQTYDAAGQVTKVTQYATAISLSGLPAAPTVAQVQALVTTNTADMASYRVYDGDGRVTATVNALGEVVKFTYDANGNVIDRVAYANRIVMGSWTPGTAPSPTADAAHDVRVRTVYDAFDRATYTLDSTGAVVAQTYDAKGNVVDRVAYAATVPVATAATQSALAAAVALIANGARDAHTRLVYDKADRVIWTADGVGGVSQQLYDKNGNVVKTIQYATAISSSALPSSVASTTSDRITAYTYDAANRQVFTINALGGVTKTVYDKDGNVTQRTGYATAIAAPTASSTHTTTGTQALIVANATNDRTVWIAYDAASRARMRVDANGGVVETTYDANGRVTQTKSYANSISLTGLSSTPTISDISGRLTASSTNDRLARYTWDAAGQQIYSVDALGYVTLKAWDALGRVTSTTQYALAIDPAAPSIAAAVVTNTNDRTSSSTYDTAGRVLTTTDALGYIESYTYNGLGEKTSFTNKKASVWTYDYDAAGRVVKETSPQVALITLTASSGVLAVDDAQSVTAAVVTAMTYDAMGNLTSRIEAQGRPEQRTTRYEYDALGRQVKTLFPPVGVYDASSDDLTSNGATSVATRKDVVQTLYSQVTYDALGNAVANRDVAGNMSYKAYDLIGQVAYDVDAEGYVTGYVRNAWGDATQLTRYGLATSLNGSPQPTQITRTQLATEIATAGRDHSADRILLTEYDRAGRVTKVTEPQSYVYDASAATGYQYASASKITQNYYNTFGELTRAAVLQNSLTSTWVSTDHYYDKRSQEVATVDALGYLTTQAYDAVGNLTQSTEFATAVASWNSNSPTAAAPTTTTSLDDRTKTYTYDRDNRKLTETQVGVEYSDPTSLSTSATRTRGNLTTTYAYDAVGNVVHVTDATGNQTYTYYDALGRVSAIAAPSRSSTLTGAALVPLTEFRRDADGNALVTISYANSATAVSETVYTKGATDTADHYDFASYDSFGHVVQTTDAAGVNHFKSYDAQGHIAKEWQGVTGNDGVTRTQFRAYRYDRVGNLTHTIDPASTAVLKGGISLSSTSATRSTNPTPGTGYTLTGTNSVTLGWPNLTNTTTGQVRVQINYTTLSSQSGAGSNESGVMVYDDYGHPIYDGLASHSAVKTQDFTASAAASGVTMSWANAASNDGGIQSVDTIRVWQQDSSGNWVLLWEGSGAQATGSGVTDVTQAQAGVTDTAYEYNAFGEAVRKGVNGGRQEYFNYDNAGHLWRTNSGDGVDKVLLYDLIGNQTSQIQSAGQGRGNVAFSSTATASDVAAMTDVRRTDMKYDAVGHLVQTLQPERLDVQGGLTMSRQYAQNTVSTTASRTDYYNESGAIVQTAWSGSSSIALSWASLGGLGSGAVRVEVDYVSLGPQVHTGGTLTGYDEQGRPVYDGGSWSTSDGSSQTLSQVLSSTSGDTGYTFSWTDSGVKTTGGIMRTTAMRVFKRDLNGNWVQVVNQSLNGYKGTAIDMAAPTDTTTTVDFQYRVAPTTGNPNPTWVSATLVKYDDVWRFDSSALALGNYEYRVYTTPAGGTTRTTSSGTFTTAAPPLAIISNTRSFISQGVYGWSAPGGGIQQVFRVRAAGSTGAWTTYTVASQGGGYDGANLNALTAGTYDYELVWTNSNSTAPYAHAVGQITVGTSSTGTRQVPYQAWVQYVSGYDEYGQPIYSYHYETRYNTETYTIPPPYSATSTTAANTGAVSQDTSAAAVITQVAVQNGDVATRYVRPIVNQTVDRWGNVVEVNDPRSTSWKTQYKYDAFNHLIQQTQPDSTGATSGSSPTTYIYYDKAGNQIAVKDANGNVNGQVFDAAGQLVTERHADTGTVNYAYDAFGDKLKTTDALGNVTTYTYDKLRRLLQTAYAAVNRYTVDSSNYTSLVSTTGLVETNTWDQAGRKLTQTNGNGETTSYRYDLLGNVLQTTFPLSTSAKTVFDALNRKVSEVDANGYSNTWTYDYFGQLTGHVDLGSNRYTYTYDNARQLVTQTNNIGLNKSYQYDAAGQLTRITDSQLNNITTYAYDLAGHHVQETTVQGGVTYQDSHLAYDTLGRLRWVGDNAAYVTMYYDAVGNRTRITTRAVNGSATIDADKYFAYDAMNRQTKVNVDSTGAIVDTDGHIVTYDVAGNRTSDQHRSWLPGATTNVTETYTYDAMNRLDKTKLGTVELSTSRYDGAGRVVWTGSTSALSDSYFDSIYGSGVDGVGRETHTNRYDANGRQLFMRATTSAGSAKYNVNYSGYDSVGNLTGYTVQNFVGQAYTNTYTYTMIRRDAYKQSVVSGTSTYFMPGDTTSSYDAAGNLIGVVDTVASGYLSGGAMAGAMNRLYGGFQANKISDYTSSSTTSRTIVNDGAGRALYNSASGQRQLYANGESLGTVGTSTPKFNFGYTPISGTYPAAQPTNYTVGSGDDLKAIAKAVYGDSSLWYVIADANGISSDRDLRVGQTIAVPTQITSKNNVGTFKPYDPTAVVGDTTPSLPTPPPPSKGGCGGFAKLIMVVVAVVATIFTAGAASILLAGESLAGATLTTIMGAGLTALGGASIGAAIIGGAVGSILSQGVGMALGVVDKFSWKSVGLSAIAAGVTAGIGQGAFGESLQNADLFVRAAVGNAVTQGIGVATGLQSKFDWRGVVASAAGAAVGQAVGQAVSNGLANVQWGDLTKDLVSRSAAGLAGGLTAAVLHGGKITVQQIAVDAFGNALGEALVASSTSAAYRGQGTPLSPYVYPEMGEHLIFKDAPPKLDFAAVDAIRASASTWGSSDAPAIDRSNDVLLVAGPGYSGSGGKLTLDLPESVPAKSSKPDQQGGGSGGSSRNSFSAEWRTQQARATSARYASGAGDVRDTSPAPIVVDSPSASGSGTSSLNMGGGGDYAVVDSSGGITIYGTAEPTYVPSQSQPSTSIRPIGPLESFWTSNPMMQAVRGASSTLLDLLMAPGGIFSGINSLARDVAGYASNAVSPQRSVVTGEVFPYQPQNGLLRSIQANGVAGTGGMLVTSAVRNAPVVGLIASLYAPNRNWRDVGGQTFNTVTAGLGMLSSGERVALRGFGNAVSGADRVVMNSGGDRLLNTMGPARLSHPEEYSTIMQDLANKGVDVRFTEGQFAYGPSASRGTPGNLVLDPDASISALRHEYGHFLDDQALGFPGQRYYYENPEFRLASERSQYLGELKTARQLGDDAARAQLIRDYLGEKNYLIDRYYFTQDGKPIPYGTFR